MPVPRVIARTAHPRMARMIPTQSLVRPQRSARRSLALIALALTGCGGAATSISRAEYGRPAQSESVTSSGARDESMPMSAPAAMPATTTASTGGSVPSSRSARASMGVAVARTTAPVAAGEPATPSISEAPTPMLIYTASVNLLVDNLTQSIDQAVELVVTNGGQLAARSDQTVQLRIPSSRFREVLARLEHIGDVLHRDVQAEDVSEQFHDLEVQLTNLRAVRSRLQEFLTRAATLQDALQVERELERVGGQIDQIEGRIRFLSSRAALSTVTINFTRRVIAATPQEPSAPDPALPFGWMSNVGLPNLLQLR
jgi:hypothetical protein